MTLQNLIIDNNCMEHVPTKALDGMQFLIALHAKYNNVSLHSCICARTTEKFRSRNLRGMNCAI